jgi:hypothetical protein
MPSVMVVTEIETQESPKAFHLFHDDRLARRYRCLQGSEESVSTGVVKFKK